MQDFARKCHALRGRARKLPVGRYKVLSAGLPVGRGATGAINVLLASIAKKATPAQPFIVVNELVCNSIARFLLLPCPPGALLDISGQTHFFSLDFNLAGGPLPPISPRAVIDVDP